MAKKKDKTYEGPLLFMFDCTTCNVHLRGISESEYNRFMSRHNGKPHVAFGGIQLHKN